MLVIRGAAAAAAPAVKADLRANSRRESPFPLVDEQRRGLEQRPLLELGDGSRDLALRHGVAEPVAGKLRDAGRLSVPVSALEDGCSERAQAMHILGVQVIDDGLVADMLGKQPIIAREGELGVRLPHPTILSKSRLYANSVAHGYPVGSGCATRAVICSRPDKPRHNIGGLRAGVRQGLHRLGRLLPARPRGRLSRWLRRRGFKPDAHYAIRIEYPTSASNAPRWNPHPELERIIATGERTYRESLATIARYRDSLRCIELHAQESYEPSWSNDWLPPLDGAAIYGFIRARSPSLYVEIGSGHSTKFAARARRDGRLQTRIVSIDPRPRAEIDELCDRVMRVPLEDADLSVFDDVSAGDMVFFDGSHRTFMNSDATVFFLEVLALLSGGVLVGVHDVFLPYDYPSEFADHYYSEQYLLAAHLIAENPALQPVLPTFYATRHPELGSLTAALLSESRLEGLDRGGHAFWFRVGGA